MAREEVDWAVSLRAADKGGLLGASVSSAFRLLRLFGSQGLSPDCWGKMPSEICHTAGARSHRRRKQACA